MTTTQPANRCIDSGTQVMVTANAGTMISCGNCGAIVAVFEVPLNSDPDDRNTIRVLAEHVMPRKTDAEIEGGWRRYTDEFTHGPAVADVPDPLHPDERTDS